MLSFPTSVSLSLQLFFKGISFTVIIGTPCCSFSYLAGLSVPASQSPLTWGVISFLKPFLWGLHQVISLPLQFQHLPGVLHQLTFPITDLIFGFRLLRYLSIQFFCSCFRASICWSIQVCCLFCHLSIFMTGALHLLAVFLQASGELGSFSCNIIFVICILKDCISNSKATFYMSQKIFIVQLFITFHVNRLKYAKRLVHVIT